MADDTEMHEKLAKLEALFARGATEGERAAAGAARDRLQAKLATEVHASDAPEVELQYSLPDVWSVRIFVALCRKHGIRPYRYPRQRRTTVMVWVQETRFEQTVAAEFRTLHRSSRLNATVEHLIADAMKSRKRRDRPST